MRFYLPNPSRLTWVTAAFIVAALLALDVANVVAYGSRDPTFHSIFVFLFFAVLWPSL